MLYSSKHSCFKYDLVLDNNYFCKRSSVNCLQMKNLYSPQKLSVFGASNFLLKCNVARHVDLVLIYKVNN